MKPRRAAVYARVSSEKQGRDSAVSIGEQIAACRKLAEENGDTVVAVYIDDAKFRSTLTGRMVEPSAKRPDRPEWVKLLAAAGKEWDVLYAWRTDRICRGNETAGMFERVLDERRFAVVLVTQQFDRDTFGLLAGGVSGYELRNIAVRMNMGREGRVKSGRYTGRIPYGYRAVRDEAGRSINYEITTEGRAFFDRLAALFLERVPLRQIAQRLAPNTVGRVWSSHSLETMLRSEFYRGRLIYGRERPAGQAVVNSAAVHPPAWDAATLAAIDAELARRSAPRAYRPRPQRHTLLFRGVLRCAYCGGVLHNAASTRSDPAFKPLYSYHCRGRDAEGAVIHPPNSISERKALAWLKAELAAVTPADIDAALDAFRPAQPIPGNAAAQAELDQLEAEEAELAQARVGASPAAARLIDARLRELRSAIQGRAAEITTTQAAAVAYDRAEHRAAVLELLDNLDRLDRVPRTDAARLISRAFPRLTVKHGVILPAV